MQTSPDLHHGITGSKGRVRENTTFHPVKVSQKEKMSLNRGYHLGVTGAVHPSLSNITLERGASSLQWIPHACDSSTDGA